MIKELKEQVQFYKDVTPMKLKEYIQTIKSELEGYIVLLSQQLEAAKKEISEKEKQIDDLKINEEVNQKKIESLTVEKSSINTNVKELEEQIKAFKERQKNSIVLAKFDNSQFEILSERAKKLGETLAKYQNSEQLQLIFKEINNRSYSISNKIKALNWEQIADEYDAGERLYLKGIAETSDEE